MNPLETDATLSYSEEEIETVVEKIVTKMNSEIEDSFTDEKQSDEDKTVKPKETV